MTDRPTIAVTLGRDLPDRPGSYRLADGYTKALLAAGSIPIALAPGLDAASVRSVLADVDGVLLPGGVDPHPSRFGEEVHPSTTIDEELDALEYEVVAAALERDLPILGICRGGQIVNIALGGDIIQHLEPGPVPHKQHEPLDIETHELRLEPDSILARLYATHLMHVNSWHHQAIGRVADGLRVVGRSEDGVVEAVESSDPRKWIVGVQYHPEQLRSGGHARLFDEFVAATRARRSE